MSVPGWKTKDCNSELRLPRRPLTLNLNVLAFMELHLHVSETTIHCARGITHKLNYNNSTTQLHNTHATESLGGGTINTLLPHSKHHHHPRAHSAAWTTPCSADAAGTTMPWRARVAIAIATVSTVVVLH